MFLQLHHLLSIFGSACPHGNTLLAHVKDGCGIGGLLVELGESNFEEELLAGQQNYYSKRSVGFRIIFGYKKEKRIPTKAQTTTEER